MVLSHADSGEEFAVVIGIRLFVSAEILSEIKNLLQSVHQSGVSLNKRTNLVLLNSDTLPNSTQSS